MEKPLITTGIQVDFTTNGIVKFAIILVAASILAGIVAKTAFKAA